MLSKELQKRQTIFAVHKNTSQMSVIRIVGGLERAVVLLRSYVCLSVDMEQLESLGCMQQSMGEWFIISEKEVLTRRGVIGIS